MGVRHNGSDDMILFTTAATALAKMTYDAEQARTGQTGTFVTTHTELERRRRYVINKH